MNIYINFSPHIEKILRFTTGDNNGPIHLKKGMRSIKFWKKKYPYMPRWQLMKQPDLNDLFLSALMQIGEDSSIEHISASYSLAYNEEEYKRMTVAQRKGLVPFCLPEKIPDGTKQIPASRRCCMQKNRGQAFRQAVIHFCYEQLADFMHQQQEMKKENFKPVAAIRAFTDKYDLSVEDYDNLVRQYYRHPACI
jgi:hypothetical protein